MGEAIERLIRLVKREDRYSIPFEGLLGSQVEAMNERFQERKEAIKLLGHRAKEANLSEVRNHQDAVQLLFPHTAYKSYPESFLANKRWDRLGKWLDSVSSYRVPSLEPSLIKDVDDWVEKLKGSGHFVSCSSGTTGKSALLVAASKDMEWCKKEAVAAFSWGSGVKPAKDRIIFSMAAFAHVPRNEASRGGITEALQDPVVEPFVYPLPRITVASITNMIVLRKAIADGTAKPGDLQEFEELSASRQKAVDDAIGSTARAVVEARSRKLHVRGLWSGVYNVAKVVRDMGYGAKDFSSSNSLAVSGGLKRALLPDNYREFVYETFNIAPQRIYLNYSMQELHSAMPRCQKGGRYHLPPWVVPLVLNKNGDALLPIIQDEYEGRAGFFDLSIDGRWGGVISGDKVCIQFKPCDCGHKGPSIRDNVVRYADLEGDDKIGCVGTVDAYVRGVS